MNLDCAPLKRNAHRSEWVDAVLLGDLARPGAAQGPCTAWEDEVIDSAATHLSQLLLTVYTDVHTAGIGEFERLMLGALREHVAFDAAWTGRGTMSQTFPVPHNNYLDRLPLSFIADWMAVRYEDPLAQKARLTPGHATALSTQQEDLPEGFRSFGQKYDLAHMVNVGTVHSAGGLITFLSLYRHASSAPFSAREAFFIETLIPHLEMAIELNRAYHLARPDAGLEQRVALCDSYGTLHKANASFLQALRVEWPQWDGGPLPQPFIDHVRYRNDAPYFGERIGIQVRPIAGLFLLESAARSHLDTLSPRESAVLKLYCDGLTYKHVAKNMQIAPTTVRHHLRNAYKKLGITNRGQLWGVLEPQRSQRTHDTAHALPCQ